MTCADCTTAAKRSHWGFTAGCRGCCARSASRTPHWRRVRDNGMQPDRQYRLLLDHFGLTHDEVRVAASLDRLEQDHGKQQRV